MNRPLALAATRLSLLALCASLGACSSLSGLFPDDKLDYRTGKVQTRSLDVPPDLSQLTRDSRYRVQGGVVSASQVGAAPAAAAAAASPQTVALAAVDAVRIERDGQQRWLVTPMPPEQVWPRLRGFWEQRGFTLEVDDAAVGIMETNWAENRANLPQDILRRTLGRLVDGLYDTGERDRFRTRVERTPNGTEIYVAHRGMQEVYTDSRQESTTWRGRPSDPQLEAEVLARLLLVLTGRDAAVAEAPAVREQAASAREQVAAAPTQPARARLLANPSTLEVDEPFDRAWRRLGVALDRGGFSVEDRDRAGGLYYVRWVDPRTAGQDEPNFFQRLMGKTDPQTPVRYRIALQAAGDKTTIAVLTSAGTAESGENGQRIAAQLVSELR